MTDDELIAGFESAELPGEQFSHVEHVRAAWWYLERHPFPEALGRFCTAIRRFAAAQGKGRAVPRDNHRGLHAVDRRTAGRRARNLTWAEFAHRNGDLLRAPAVDSRPLLHGRDACVRPRTARVRHARPREHGSEIKAGGRLYCVRQSVHLPSAATKSSRSRGFHGV